MEVHQVCEICPGSLVWVWIVRMGRGRWWPGSVASISAVEPFPIIDTRFECRSAGKKGSDGPAFVGISTTRMRYLELRNPHLKGDDRPTFVPIAIFAKPEKSSAGSDEMHPATRTVDDRDQRIASPVAVKKSRSRKKTKAPFPTQDANVVAIET
jgi:hypothetical protein